jgi:hypothetical protein
MHTEVVPRSLAMSTSRTALRLITILFLLAGILLLRKPVFGQAITAAPTHALPLKTLSILEHQSPIVDTSGPAKIWRTL